MRIKVPDRHSYSRDFDSLIRRWIAVAAAVVCWVLPIPWYFSAVLFLGALLPLTIFYPLLTRPRK